MNNTFYHGFFERDIRWETPAASLCEEAFRFDSKIQIKKNCGFSENILRIFCSCTSCTFLCNIQGNMKLRNASYFFKNFHRIREANRKLVTKSTGLVSVGGDSIVTTSTKPYIRHFKDFFFDLVKCKICMYLGIYI